MSINTINKARSRVANEHKKLKNGGAAAALESLQEARRELAEAKLQAYIERVVASAPPLTTQQRDRLAVLLRGAV